MFGRLTRGMQDLFASDVEQIGLLWWPGKISQSGVLAYVEPVVPGTHTLEDLGRQFVGGPGEFV